MSALATIGSGCGNPEYARETSEAENPPSAFGFFQRPSKEYREKCKLCGEHRWRDPEGRRKVIGLFWDEAVANWFAYRWVEAHDAPEHARGRVRQ